MRSSQHRDPFHITPDQVHFNVTLPTTTSFDQALFVHPDVTAVLVHHIDTTTTTTKNTIPDTHHHHNRYSASTTSLANLLTAPLRFNVQSPPPNTNIGSGIHCCFGDEDDDEDAALFSQSEAGVLIRGLVCQRLRLLRTFSATMLQDPQGRFTVNVAVRIIAVKQHQQVKVHDLHVPLEEENHTLVINDNNDNNEGEKQPSGTRGNIEEIMVSARERRLKEESEMLDALGSMWLPDGDTFRHSRSQQVPVSEAILEKLGFVVGSMSLVRPFPSSTTATILPSSVGWNGDDDDVMTASSQCGQSVVSDDEDDHGSDFFTGYYA